MTVAPARAMIACTAATKEPDRAIRNAAAMSHPAALFLADGSRFDGTGLDIEGLALGEAVFFTGMTGYEEALTDPSYAGQILTFTYPMIGNYGISGAAAQYHRACVAGVVTKRITRRPSHHQAVRDLASWLSEQRIPAMTEADTRAITIALREHGTIWAALAVGERALQEAPDRLRAFAREANTSQLVPSVAIEAARTDGVEGGPHVVLIDCGVKRSILRELAALGASVTVVPYDTSHDEILDHRPDGIVISPGPGDPADLVETRDVLRTLLGRVPMLGICLGHQLLALALGARTYKLPYGHRGGNHPVKHTETGAILVTAHNHGYAVDGTTLPAGAHPTLVNLNDGTNEGFRHPELRIDAVQFHPEASPGPLDARFVFAQWFASLALSRR